MSLRFDEDKIIKTEKFFCKTLYDVSNTKITARFDGRGNIVSYAPLNKWDIFDCFYSMLSVNGTSIDFLQDKQVSMIGKIQTTTFELAGTTVKLSQFIDNSTNAIFTEYHISSKGSLAAELVFNFGINFTSYLKNIFASRLSVKTFRGVLGGYIKNMSKANKGIFEKETVYVIKNNVTGDFYIDLALNKESVALEKSSQAYNQYKITQKSRDGSLKIRFVISAGSRFDDSFCDVEKCYNEFDLHLKEAENYIKNLPCPQNLDPSLRAYYKNLINCSLSMYKETGRFKGFIAGIDYQLPARTYYRDGYWTILSVLPVNPDLVKQEILTLSLGISPEGKCPSAVKSTFKNWWQDHYDSPSFFVIMLYDYVKTTGDKSILNEKWNKKTILDAAELVIAKLANSTDETGLIVKSGKYNRRDWADNVFREGYVTYDEVLYARALYGLSYLFSLKDDNEKSLKYKTSYEKVKQAINDILWDQEKGYYVNYKNSLFTEDNLSIDTVVAVLFGIADEQRSKKMLANMENILESKNNKDIKAGDFGVLCVYPFYKSNESVVLKSSLPYYYHNGADWPYLSCAYAYAKLMCGMDYVYPLKRWFDYNLEKGNYTPMEFFSPLHTQGSLMQGWSSLGAFVLSYPDGNFFR